MSNALSTTEDFSSTSKNLAVAETASTALAAQAKAMVESRYVMAMRNPRNMLQVRLDLLAECNRPAFANNKSAYYIKPIGKGVEGLGIRFVEVAFRCMKNILVESSIVFEDSDKEVHRVSVTDLEANVTYPMDVVVTKTVERSKPSDDGSYISMRKNSFGKNTYTVPAQDEELLNKRGALISKAIRTLGTRIIPGDLQDEATEIILRIRTDAAARDPGAESKRITDAFNGIGVSANDLIAYLGHDIKQCSPSQLVQLRGIFGAIKDGEATWKGVMDNKIDNQGSDGKTTTNSTASTVENKQPVAGECTAEQFETIRKRNYKKVSNKEVTPDSLIADLETKYLLTSDQKSEIMTWSIAND